MPSDNIYFDLYRELTTNVDFINKVSRIMKSIELADKSRDFEAGRYHIHELLKECEFNASLLVPLFFPKYPEFTPMTLWTRPHAFSMMAFTLLGSMTCQASRQVGKCVSGDTVVTVRSKDGTADMSIKELFDESEHHAGSEPQSPGHQQTRCCDPHTPHEQSDAVQMPKNTSAPA